MATSSAIIMKNVLNDYVSNLHEYLGPYCFTKGAFVIEDDGTLFALLEKNKSIEINGVFRSHTSFLKGSEPIFECDVDLYLECDECIPNTKDRVHVRNIKWYPFQEGSQKYIYFKLEGHPTFSKMGTVNVAHAVQYVKRLLVDKEGPCKKRREDCKEKDCLSNAKELNHNKYKIEQEEPIPIVESHKRAGSEIFIPLGVSQYFLKNIDKKMNFQFDNGTAMISTNSTIKEVVSNEPEKEDVEEEEEVYEPEEPQPAPKEGDPQAPATQAPVTQAPVTQAPVTQAPVTQSPATQSPATQAPVTQEPVTQEPVTQEPVTQEPATQEPATQEPVTQEPATQEPATQEPVQAPLPTEPVQAPVTTEGAPQGKAGGKMSRKRMPFTIRKLKGRRLYTVKGPGRTYAKGTTLKKAKAQIRLLYMIDRQNAKGTRRQR